MRGGKQVPPTRKSSSSWECKDVIGEYREDHENIRLIHSNVRFHRAQSNECGYRVAVFENVSKGGWKRRVIRCDQRELTFGSGPVIAKMRKMKGILPARKGSYT